MNAVEDRLRSVFERAGESMHIRPLGAGDLGALERRAERIRTRRRAGAASVAAIAAVLAVVVPIAVATRGEPHSGAPATTPTVPDGREGAGPAKSTPMTFTVPAGWSEVETTATRCADTPKTILRLEKLEQCFGEAWSTNPSVADFRTPPVFPVAYVTNDIVTDHAYVWTDGKLQLGRRIALPGGYLFSVQPREGWRPGMLHVLASTRDEAEALMATIAPRTEAGRMRAVSVRAPDVSVDGSIEFVSAGFPMANHVLERPAAVPVIAPSWRTDTVALQRVDDFRALFDNLRPIHEAAAQCLVDPGYETPNGPGDRASLVPGITAVHLKWLPNYSWQSLEILVGPSSCPIIVDSKGGVTLRPDGFLHELARVMYLDDDEGRAGMAAFTESWGEAGP